MFLAITIPLRCIYQAPSMKKTVLLLLIHLITYHVVFAQLETRRDLLMVAAKNMDIAERSSYAAAIIKAKQNGWALSYKSRNKSTATLMGIDNFGQPRYYISYTDPLQTITVNTNKLWPSGSTGFNLSGSSDSITNKLGMWDEGAARNTHKEITGRITQKDNVTNIIDHSTHVMGILLAKGVNPLAKGMAYNLKGILGYDWNNDASEMATAAAEGLLISNHSYGTVAGWDYNDDSSRWEFNGRWNEKEDYRFGLYDNQAQQYDSIAYNAPNYLIVKSAGNGRSSIGPSKDASGKWYNNDSTYWRRDQNGKWFNAGVRPDSLSSNNSYETLAADVNAKNLLTIGAVYGIAAGYSKKEDVLMTNFSCWGPTDDGRIKPDLVSDGVSVYSTLGINDSSYGYLSGTSMAAPGASASLLLLQELSQKLSLKPLRSATIKAAAIHTANEAGTFAGPDYKYGWGLLNTSEAASVLNNAISSGNAITSSDLVYENVLQNTETKTYTIVASGKKPVKATLVWTDVKGSVSTKLNDATPKLINDLDLKITSNGIITEAWTLNPKLPDAAAIRGNNKIDNVEKVEIDTAIVGNSYSITVNHKNTLDRSQQAYSLVISGGGGTAYCSSTASSASGSKLDSVSLNNIQFVNNTTSQYIDNTNKIINAEPAGILSFFIKTGSVDATNNTRFIKVFIDYNNNGAFETTEEVAVSSALTNGIYSGTIDLPSTLTIGTFTRLRIVEIETNTASSVLACGTYTYGETQDYTLKVNTASNDLQLSDIVSPTGGICKKDIQYVTVKIINNGGTKQSNFPINLQIKKGNITIANINETFTGNLNGLESMNYTFQQPIAIESNTIYSFTAAVTLVNDQQKNNNSLTTSIVSAVSINAPNATASNCNSTLQLNIANPITGNTYLWYDSSSTKNPIAVGTAASINTTATKLTVGQGYNNFVGPATNTSLGDAGGYNSFSGNYVKVNATAPITIETAKLYTGYPGKIDFILGTFIADNTDGTYSYYPIQTVTLNVGASSPSPAAASSSAGTPFVVGDTGKTYYLNLKIPQAGNYILIAKCTDATLFRNNGLGTTTYPTGPTKLFSYTGNSVPTASGNFQNFYYFFYNTQISTNDCLSPLTAVTITNVGKPIITQNSDTTLTATAASNYQWYMNDSLINGATNQTIKATKNALYKVTTNTGGCQNTSDPKLILITDVNEASVKEIALKITSTDNIENLITGNSFFVQFSNIQTQNISLDLLNAMGESVFHKENLVNQRSPQRISINNLNAGVYFVKIYANKKVYIQRVFISNN